MMREGVCPLLAGVLEEVRRVLDEAQPQARSDGPLLVSVPRAAELLSVGRSEAYQLVLRGEIASVKIGRSRRVPMAALEAFVERLVEEQVGGRGE